MRACKADCTAHVYFVEVRTMIEYVVLAICAALHAHVVAGLIEKHTFITSDTWLICWLHCLLILKKNNQNPKLKNQCRQEDLVNRV